MQERPKMKSGIPIYQDTTLFLKENSFFALGLGSDAKKTPSLYVQGVKFLLNFYHPPVGNFRF
jgi:hypothetical protein